MKKIIVAILLLFTAPIFVSSDATVSSEAVGSVVQLKIVETDRGVIIRYLDNVSGVLVGKDGKILTSLKATKRMADFPQKYRAVVCKNSGAIDSKNCGFEAVLVGMNTDADIALLQVDTLWETSVDNSSYGKVFRLHYDTVQQQKYPFEHYAPTLGALPEIGSPLSVLGYPKDRESGVAVASATVSGKDKREKVLDVFLTKGLSGGAVFNDRNEFVGMVTADGAESPGRFIGSDVINEYFIDRADDTELAGSLEVPCYAANTVRRQDRTCTCTPDFSWQNSMAKCEKIEPDLPALTGSTVGAGTDVGGESDGYCGANAYRVGDACECQDGYLWGTPEGSAEVICMMRSDQDTAGQLFAETETDGGDGAENEATASTKIYSWKKLRFTPIDGLKIFAKKLRDEKVLLIWKPTEGQKAKGCVLSYRDKTGAEADVIFQRKHVALVRAAEGQKYAVEIAGCTVDDTEVVAESRFLVGE